MSLPIQLPSKHYFCCSLFRKWKINYLSLNHAKKNCQTVFWAYHHLNFCSLNIIGLKEMCIHVFLKIQTISRVNCVTIQAVLIARPKYTFWSFKCALITLIPSCNCGYFYVNWKNWFMLKKKIGVHPNIQSCHVDMNTLGITSEGDPHSCCSLFKIM